MTEWISCADRMPEEDKRVLIVCDEGICSGKYSTEQWQCDPIGSYASDGCVFDVTHWMPLPEWMPLTESPKQELISEFGCSVPIRFNTSDGIKTMIPGKSYDDNLDEILTDTDSLNEYYYIGYECGIDESVFEKAAEFATKEMANEWVNEKQHLRVWHEKYGKRYNVKIADLLSLQENAGAIVKKESE